MARIVIVSGIQIIDNPRVVKEADALCEAGHDVEVLGAIYDEASRRDIDQMLANRSWRHTAVVDFTRNSIVGVAARFGLRARFRLARLAKTSLGLELPDQLGLAVGRLYRLARSRTADLYIAHLEQALWAAQRLVDDGFNVSADVEDWYSEDGLPQDQAQRPISLMKAYERKLFARAKHVTTTSRPLADALARTYGGPTPALVYNSFPLSERATIDGRAIDRRDQTVPSITWFSQTIGPGRGLEDLVSALAEVRAPFQLHLRGAPRPGYVEALLGKAPQRLRDRIQVHSRVVQEELLSRLAEHDIGYCGELADCASRDLTVTNKLFEYMRAGLAIVASDTAGQREVARQSPGAIRLFAQRDVTALRDALEFFLADPAALRQAKTASLTALEAHFDWSHSKRRLQAIAAQSLGQAQKVLEPV